MERGDISNTISPRLLIVFEGLLGTLDPEAKIRRFRRRPSANQVVATYALNEVVATHVWHMTWQKGLTLEAVTYLGASEDKEDYQREVAHWIDANDLPISRVLATTPGALGRSLAYSPAVLGVFDAARSRFLSYGAKGHLVDPEHPDFFA